VLLSAEALPVRLHSDNQGLVLTCYCWTTVVFTGSCFDSVLVCWIDECTVIAICNVSKVCLLTEREEAVYP